MMRAMRMPVALAMLALIAADGGAHRLRSGERWGDRQVDDGGAAVVLIDAPVAGAVVQNLTVRGAYRVIENNKQVSATGLIVRNVHATGVTRGLARFRADSSGTIENSNVTFAPEPQHMPDLPEGLAFQERAHDWLVQHVRIRGAQMQMPPDQYWNGDGIATERQTHGFRFIDVRADDNTDAGFDLKSEDTFLDRVSASGNAKNFRFWTTVRVGSMTVGDVQKRGGTTGTAGIWLLADRARPQMVTIDRLVVRMTKPAAIFGLDGGAATIRIGRCDIQAPPGSRLIAVDGIEGEAPRNGLVDFKGGPGCHLPGSH